MTTQPNNEMYALANYNLGYIAFHRKDYTPVVSVRFGLAVVLSDGNRLVQILERTEQHLQMPTTVSETAT